ncbi:hypothetical protein DSECCO2_572150 [anaerobic digester metagenome]
MSVLRQTVAYSRYGINLEALLIIVASAAVIGKLCFQYIVSLVSESELASGIIQHTFSSIVERHFFIVMQQ